MSSVKNRLPAVMLAFALAAPAAAGGLYREHAYADSFGNLVVYAPSGYKRIVVGKGYLADRVASAAGEEGPDVVRLHRTPGAVRTRGTVARDFASVRGIEGLLNLESCET